MQRRVGKNSYILTHLVDGNKKPHLLANLTQAEKLSLLGAPQGDSLYIAKAILMRVSIENQQFYQNLYFEILPKIKAKVPTTEIMVTPYEQDHKLLYPINLSEMLLDETPALVNIVDANREIVGQVVVHCNESCVDPKFSLQIYSENSLSINSNTELEHLQIFTPQEVKLSGFLTVNDTLHIHANKISLQQNKYDQIEVGSLSLMSEQICHLQGHLRLGKAIIKAGHLIDTSYIEANEDVTFIAENGEYSGRTHAKNKITRIGIDIIESDQAQTHGSELLIIANEYQTRSQQLVKNYQVQTEIGHFQGKVLSGEQTIVQTNKYAKITGLFLINGKLASFDSHITATADVHSRIIRDPNLVVTWKQITSSYTHEDYGVTQINPVRYRVNLQHNPASTATSHVQFKADHRLAMAGLTSIKDAQVSINTPYFELPGNLWHAAEKLGIDIDSDLQIISGNLTTNGKFRTQSRSLITEGKILANQAEIKTKNFTHHGEFTANELQAQVDDLTIAKNAAMDIQRSIIHTNTSFTNYGSFHGDSAHIEAGWCFYNSGKFHVYKQAITSPFYFDIVLFDKFVVKEKSVTAYVICELGFKRAEQTNYTSIINFSPGISLQSVLLPPSVSGLALTLVNSAFSVATLVYGVKPVIMAGQLLLNGALNLRRAYTLTENAFRHASNLLEKPDSLNVLKTITHLAQFASATLGAYSMYTAINNFQNIPIEVSTSTFSAMDVINRVTPNLASLLSNSSRFAVLDISPIFVGFGNSTYSLIEIKAAMFAGFNSDTTVVKIVGLEEFIFSGSTTAWNYYGFGGSDALLGQSQLNTHEAWLNPVFSFGYNHLNWHTTFMYLSQGSVVTFNNSHLQVSNGLSAQGELGFDHSSFQTDGLLKINGKLIANHSLLNIGEFALTGNLEENNTVIRSSGNQSFSPSSSTTAANTTHQGDNIEFAGKANAKEKFALIAKDKLSLKHRSKINNPTGTIVLHSEQGQYAGDVVTAELDLKDNSITSADIKDLIQSQGRFKTLKASMSKAVETDKDILIAKIVPASLPQKKSKWHLRSKQHRPTSQPQPPMTYKLGVSFSLKGHTITVDSTNFSSTGDLTFTSTSGTTLNHATLEGKNVHITSDAGTTMNNQSHVLAKLHADVEGVRVVNNHGVVTGETVRVNATGSDVVNRNASILAASDTLIVHAAGNVINECEETTRRRKIHYTASVMNGGNGQSNNQIGLVVTADDKVINDGSVMASGSDSSINGKKGIYGIGRTHVQIVSESDSSNWLGFRHKHHQVWSTVSALPQFFAAGKNTFKIGAGKFRFDGAQIIGAMGNEIYAPDKNAVEFYAIDTRTKIYDVSTSAFGLFRKTSKLDIQGAIPTRLIDVNTLANTTIFTRGEIDLRGAELYLMGKAEMQASKVYFASTLNTMKYSQWSRSFSFALPFLHLPGDIVDLTSNLQGVYKAQNSTEFFLNSFNSLIGGINLSGNILDGINHQRLLGNTLKEFNIGDARHFFNPSLSLGVQFAYNQNFHTLRGVGGVFGNSLTINADQIIFDYGLPVKLDTLVINGKIFIQRGAPATSHTYTKMVNPALNLNIYDGIVGGSITGAYSTSHSQTWIPQILQVQSMDIHVQDWLQQAASVTADHVSGQVKNFYSQSMLDQHKDRSIQVSASTSGSASLMMHNASSSKVNRTSGIEVNGDNTSNAPLHIENAHLLGAHIDTNDTNRLQIAHKEETAVHEKSQSHTYGMAGNVNSLLPSKHSNQPIIPTVRLDYAEQLHSDDLQATRTNVKNADFHYHLDAPTAQHLDKFRKELLDAIGLLISHPHELPSTPHLPKLRHALMMSLNNHPELREVLMTRLTPKPIHHATPVTRTQTPKKIFTADVMRAVGRGALHGVQDVYFNMKSDLKKLIDAFDLEHLKHPHARQGFSHSFLNTMWPVQGAPLLGLGLSPFEVILAIKAQQISLAHKSTLEKVEMSTEFATSFLVDSLIWGYVFKGARMVRNLKEFGSIRGPIKFHNNNLENLVAPPPPIKNLVPQIRQIRDETVLLYVVLEDNSLIIAHQDYPQTLMRAGHPSKYIHHPEIAKLNPVISAGEVTVTNGQIVGINNASGHYLPTGAHLDKLTTDAFVKHGFPEAKGKYNDLTKYLINAPTLVNPIITQDKIGLLPAHEGFLTGATISLSKNPIGINPVMDQSISTPSSHEKIKIYDVARAVYQGSLQGVYNSMHGFEATFEDIAHQFKHPLDQYNHIPSLDLVEGFFVANRYLAHASTLENIEYKTQIAVTVATPLVLTKSLDTAIKAMRFLSPIKKIHPEIPHEDFFDPNIKREFDKKFHIMHQSKNTSYNSSLLMGATGLFARISHDKHENKSENFWSLARSESAKSVARKYQHFSPTSNLPHLFFAKELYEIAHEVNHSHPAEKTKVLTEKSVGLAAGITCAEVVEGVCETVQKVSPMPLAIASIPIQAGAFAGCSLFAQKLTAEIRHTHPAHKNTHS